MKKYGFGVDIGGTTCKIGLFDMNGTILEKWEIKTNTENHGAAILDDVAAAVLDKMKEKEITKEDVQGIGLGVPGPVDSEGTVHKCVNLGWDVINVEKALNEKTGLLVKAGNEEIIGVDSLADKIVATQSGSTGPDILAEYAPDATVQEFANDLEARTALEQGRVDAYVTDYTLLLNAIVKNPDAYEIAGDVFGPEDNYGIGLPKDSDGVAFVNDFLKKIEEDGTWAKLWQISLGDRTGIDTVPEAPAIEE